MLLKRILSGCLAVATIAALVSCSKTPVYQVRHEPSDPLSGLSYHEETQIRYRITSDESFLYIRFDSERRDLGMYLMQKGLDISIDTTMKKKAVYTLTYPLPRPDRLPAPPQSSGREPGFNMIPVQFGPLAKWSTENIVRQFNTDSASMAGLFSVENDREAGKLVYQAAIPWAWIADGVRLRDGKPFMLGIRLTKPLAVTFPSGGPGGGGPGRPGGGSMDEGGMSGGGMPEEGMSEGGRPGGGSEMRGRGGMERRERTLSEPVIVWIAVSTRPDTF